MYPDLPIVLALAAATALLLATVRAYEHLLGQARAERDEAIQHAEDSQVLLNAVIEEAESQRMHPAFRPHLVAVDGGRR